MIRLLADQDFDEQILQGLALRNPDVDIVRVREIGLSEADDGEVLAHVASSGRVGLLGTLLAHDLALGERLGKPFRTFVGDAGLGYSMPVLTGAFDSTFFRFFATGGTMATFKGRIKDFNHYIGPQLRIVVQNLTRKHKADAGACEYCGSNKNLQSAHLRGRDRPDIIHLLLQPLTTNGVVSVDLGNFERDFKLEHKPFVKAMLILCKDCHHKYDSRHVKTGRPILPITLDPPRVDDFKKQLLVSKSAELTVFYNDGTKKTRPWNASKFSETANVFGNLRTRHEFRQGKWQACGIVKLHVQVYKDA